MKVTRASLLKRAAIGTALILPAGTAPILLASAPAAHAAGVCVGVGTNPLPGYPCPNPDPAGNVFDVNVFAAQPCEAGEPDGTGKTGLSVGSCAAGVDAWTDLSGGVTAPQGELEVTAANTSTGISSNGNPE